PRRYCCQARRQTSGGPAGPTTCGQCVPARPAAQRSSQASEVYRPEPPSGSQMQTATSPIAVVLPFSRLAPVWSEGFVYDHSRHRQPALLLLGGVDTVRSQIHSKAVHHVRDGKIFEFLIVISVPRLVHGNETAGARDVDSAEPRIELHNISTRRHRKMRDGLVSVEGKHGESSVSGAQKKCTVVF